MRLPPGQIYRFDGFQVDEPNRLLLRDGIQVPLSKKAFDLLLVLLENEGSVVTKDDLLDKVWPDQFVEEVNLTVQIAALRKALGEQRDNPRYIITIPKYGYRFVAEFRSEEDTSPVISQPTRSSALNDGPEAVRVGSNRYLKRRRGVLLAVGGMVFVAAAIAIGFLFSDRTPATPAIPFQKTSIEQLTANSKATLAAVSPDAKLFAYVSQDQGLETLLLAHVGGGDHKELLPAADVSYRTLRFSPDGNTIYYNLSRAEDRAGSLFRIPTLGGVPEKLRANINARIAFSPDFSRIAYVSRNVKEKTSTLIVADMDGSNERELVARDEKLPFRSFSPSWSPDGTKIAVGAVGDDVKENYEVFVASVEDGRLRQLTSFGWHEVLATVWRADGRGLIMVAREDHEWNNTQLWHVSYPRGSVSRIISDLDSYNAATVSLSSDGQNLLAIQIQRLSSIWVAQADQLSQAKQIVPASIGALVGNSSVDWAADGKLFYGSQVKGSMTIWTMDADGKDQKQLTSAGYVDTHVRATFDGRYIVFQSNRSGSWEIWRAGTDGGNMRQLTTGGNNKEPAVTPDGRYVVYTSLRDGLRTIWRVPIEGGEPVRLSDDPAGWPHVSPDGRSIACEYDIGGVTKLAILPIDGGEPLKVFDTARLANFFYGIRWTPDGRHVTYRDWVNGIWSQPIEGGEARRLEGLPEEKLGGYGWSRDGRSFVFIRGSEMREVVLIKSN